MLCDRHRLSVPLFLSAVLFCFSITILSAAPQSKDPGKLWDLVKRFTQHQTDEQRASVLKDLGGVWPAGESLSKSQFQEMEKLLRQPGGFPPAKADAIEEHTVPVEGAKGKFPTYVYLPPKYDPAKPAPLFLVIHGGPIPELKRAQKHAQGGIKDWKSAAQDHGWILMAPAEASGGGTPEINFKSVVALIAFAKTRYNVDPDRIHLTGHSRGGFASWIMGLVSPDRVAGIAPDCGGEDFGEHLINAANLPVFNLQGKKDNQGNANFILPRNAKKNKEKLDELQKQFPSYYDHVYRETELGHAPSVMHYPEAMKWLSERPRNIYSAMVRGDFKNIRGDSQRLYWFEKLDGDKSLMEAAIDRDKNEIRVTWPGAKKYRLYLHDKMLDLDKPVKVFTNGKSSFEGQVTRSPQFILRHIQEAGDMGRVYANAIEITVP